MRFLKAESALSKCRGTGMAALFAAIFFISGTHAAEKQRPPEKVICLAPSLCELAADVLGQQIGRIVGVSEQTDYPPSLKQVPSVGSYQRIHLEKIASLRPDLVLAMAEGSLKDQVNRLTELGIHVKVVKSGSIAEIRESMITIGRALGFPERGVAMARQLERGVEKFRRRANGRAQKKVLLQLGADPLIVVGGQSFLNEALEIVGAKNSYADLPQGYPRPTLEDVVRRNPDQIVVLANGDQTRIFEKMAARWKEIPVRAAKRNAISVLKSDALLRPSLRLLEGLAALEQTLFGDEQNP